MAVLNLAMIESTSFVGSAGPKVSAKTMYTTKLPIVACTTVINKMRANLVKNITLQKSITSAEEKVVTAAARMEGPM